MVQETDAALDVLSRTVIYPHEAEALEIIRFSSNCTIRDGSTPNGWNELYTGTCSRCGDWSDTAA